MHLKQAYRVALLGPGKSLLFVDAENPGRNVSVTAPEDAYINLSLMVQAILKEGIYSVVATFHVKAASNLASNADGSISLRPAPINP